MVRGTGTGTRVLQRAAVEEDVARASRRLAQRPGNCRIVGSANAYRAAVDDDGTGEGTAAGKRQRPAADLRQATRASADDGSADRQVGSTLGIDDEFVRRSCANDARGAADGVLVVVSANVEQPAERGERDVIGTKIPTLAAGIVGDLDGICRQGARESRAIAGQGIIGGARAAARWDRSGVSGERRDG